MACGNETTLVACSLGKPLLTTLKWDEHKNNTILYQKYKSLYLNDTFFTGIESEIFF
jgi:hypothetical protein